MEGTLNSHVQRMDMRLKDVSGSINDFIGFTQTLSQLFKIMSETPVGKQVIQAASEELNKRQAANQTQNTDAEKEVKEEVKEESSEKKE